jgi:predicted nucleic acid-binding protein
VAFTAVLDANVLFPASQRDLLVRLAQTGLFAGRWTDQILDEMERAICRRQPELAGRLARTRELMCDAVPGCLVTGYADLIDALQLPDQDDRHVFAAAIRSGAQVIVTDNQRDFPADALTEYGIEAQSADEFVHHLVTFRPTVVATTLQRQADSLTNPPQSLDELLDRLENVGLRRSVAELRNHLRP